MCRPLSKITFTPHIEKLKKGCELNLARKGHRFKKERPVSVTPKSRREGKMPSTR